MHAHFGCFCAVSGAQALPYYATETWLFDARRLSRSSPRWLATLVVALAVLASAWHMLAPPDWHWDAFSGGASLAQRRISDVLLQRSATVQREGNLTAATALLEQAVRANPQNDDAHFAIAQLAAQTPLHHISAPSMLPTHQLLLVDACASVLSRASGTDTRQQNYLGV